VAAIAQTECILSLKKCMENERDLIATCCETLTRLFKCQHVSIYAHTLDDDNKNNKTTVQWRRAREREGRGDFL
jgi:hypothetical protein